MPGWSSARCAPARRSASISSLAPSIRQARTRRGCWPRSSSMSGPAGIVVSPPLSDDLELARLRAARGRADGRHLGRRAARARSFPASASTNARPGGRIGQHLVALGHRRLGFVKGPPDHQSAALRYDGFLDALRDAGIDDEPWTATGDFTFQSGVEAAERLLREQGSVTALACANDDMAAGAMLALHRAGLEIPSAMSVTGFDDTPMSEVVWPPLTTVRQPIKYPRRARGAPAVRESIATPTSIRMRRPRTDCPGIRQRARISFAPLDSRLGFEAPKWKRFHRGMEARP